MVLYQNLCSAEVAILDFHSMQTAFIRLLAASAVDRGYEHRSGQTKHQTANGSYVCMYVCSKRNEHLLYRGVHRLLPTKIQFICLSGFRRNDFLEIDQSETRIAFGGHVC